MVTTLTKIQRNGAASQDTRAGYGRRVRIRRGVGLVLVLVAALWGHQRDAAARERQPVLVVARPVSAGQVVSDADVRVAYVALDGHVAHLRRGARVAGKIARVDLHPGGLLVDDWLASPEQAGNDMVLLPLPLKTGRFPPGLRAGDHVIVVVTGSDTGPVNTAEPTGDPDDAGLAASVVAVDGDRGNFGVAEPVVTVLIPKTQLARLAAAAGQGRVLLAESVP